MDNHQGEAYSSETRLLAALCYVLFVVAPVLVLATGLRRQRFLRFHGYQGLVVTTALLAIYVLMIPATTYVLLYIPCIGGAFACLAPFLYVGGLGLQFYWAFLAYQGHLFTIPVAGRIAASAAGN